jgi:hypothetical protein
MLALRHDIAHGEWAPLMAAEIHMVEKWWVWVPGASCLNTSMGLTLSTSLHPLSLSCPWGWHLGDGKV